MAVLPDESAMKSSIDLCNRCTGYVKTLKTLRLSPPAEVMLDDLASVELDVAAAARDYSRPPRLGYVPDWMGDGTRPALA